MSERKTDDATLIAALRILARDIQSGDSCANAALLEAAARLAELVEERRWVSVGERLPDGEEWVDVAGLWGDSVGWHQSTGWHNVEEDPFPSEVTHWRNRGPGPGPEANG